MNHHVLAPPVALLLPGQGAQYRRMGAALHGYDRVFTEVMDEFLELLGADGERLRELWLTGEPADGVHDGLNAQPLLFGVAYAAAKSLEHRGLRPAVLLGHSIGELCAATLAGMWDLPAAARILAARSSSLGKAPRGGMLAVAAAPDTVEPLIPAECARAGVAVGAVNGAAQTVLAGPEAELAATDAVLKAKGMTTRAVRTAQPFHSPAMAEAARVFQEAIAAEQRNSPAIPLVSSLTAEPVTEQQALDPGFWASQMSRPVLFWPALQALDRRGAHTYVEVGPGKGLAAAARRLPTVLEGSSRVVSTLPSERGDTVATWESALAALASAGHLAG